jgi:heme/copper-type cytochrome/quinol oxidase subunit 1
MRDRLRECLFLSGLSGLAILEFGWIFYPPLGEASSVIHLAVFLALLIAASAVRHADPK